MNWKQIPLSQAYWFQEGPGIRNWQFTTSGIKLLNVGNITKNGTIDLDKTDKFISIEEAQGTYSHFLIDEGDMVIASSGISFDHDCMLRTRGAFVEKKHLPLCLNTSTIRFKAIDGVSNLQFLKFWLDSFEFRSQISRFVTGSAQQNFGPSHLKETQITLPPLPEQTRIAGLLARADRLRRLRRFTRAMGDSLLQSVFLDMFGDPAGNSQNWEMSTFGELSTFVTSGSRGWADYYSNSGARFIRVQDLRGNRVNFENMAYVMPKDKAEMARTRVKPNDLLLAITGATIGLSALVPNNIGEAYVNQHVAIIRLKEKINPYYAAAFMAHSYGGQKQIAALQYGDTKPGMSLEQIKDLTIPLPPLPLQEQFAQVVAQVERLRARQAESARQGEALFQALLSQSFGG